MLGISQSLYSRPADVGGWDQVDKVYDDKISLENSLHTYMQVKGLTSHVLNKPI